MSVAISNDFLDAFAALPKPTQKKVREFTTKFQADPTSHAINYEPIHEAKDPKVRTVRIGLDYRAVVLHPKTGDTYVLLWVDHHDEAIAWTRNRTFDVNPVTGSLQIVNAAEAEAALAAAPPPTVVIEQRLFDHISDDELLAFGIPAPLLPSVRSIRDETDLDRLKPFLPGEGYDALVSLAAGFSVEETLEELAKAAVEAKRIAAAKAAEAPERRPREEDLVTALAHPDSQRRFYVVEDLRNLMEVLNAPLARWRIFLHPSQRKLVQQAFNGPARVLGGAGTGKTVVLMHRARSLAKDVFTATEDRLLVTTFTRNLASAIGENLKSLCGDELKRIEVLHVDAIAARILRSHSMEFSPANQEHLAESWQSAVAAAGDLTLPIGFYREEWSRVIQAQGIAERAGYLLASRTGRGTRLSRAMRAKIWDVFEEYQAELRSRGLMEWVDVSRQARQLVEKDSTRLPYRAALVDETQDLHPEQLRLLRALVPQGPNDLFLVGDAHQRIYERKVVLSQVGINVRGRSRTLRINYRTTDEIRRWAVGVLSGKAVDDLDGGLADERGYRSLFHGARPVVRIFPSSREEQEYVVKTLQERLKVDSPDTICVVARTKRQLRDEYIPAIQAAGIPVLSLDGRETDTGGEGIRVATMHRVKGLEFRSVIIAGASDGYVPLSTAVDVGDDAEVKDEAILRERCLLYVAASRARDFLAVCAAGKTSPFLANMRDKV